MTRALLVTGSGGVGKTTVAGAIGVLAAERGIETLVLTVDPARRLAQALGIDELHMEPHPVTDRLEAAMLDPTASWEALIRRHADAEPHPTASSRADSSGRSPIASRRARPTQRRTTPPGSSRPGATTSSSWTRRPSEGGADFYAAPGEIRDLVAGRALRILTGPADPGTPGAVRGHRPTRPAPRRPGARWPAARGSGVVPRRSPLRLRRDPAARPRGGGHDRGGAARDRHHPRSRSRPRRRTRCWSGATAPRPTSCSTGCCLTGVDRAGRWRGRRVRPQPRPDGLREAMRHGSVLETLVAAGADGRPGGMAQRAPDEPRCSARPSDRGRASTISWAR